MSAWRLRLGIQIERIKPGDPQQNGRHERMHRTLKQATTKPPGSMLQQQDKFERFVQEYNFGRPHEALAMETPASLYQPSGRPTQGFPNCSNPSMTAASPSPRCGRICMERKKVTLSTVLPGQLVGVRQVDDEVSQVSFMYNLLTASQVCTHIAW